MGLLSAADRRPPRLSDLSSPVMELGGGYLGRTDKGPQPAKSDPCFTPSALFQWTLTASLVTALAASCEITTLVAWQLSLLLNQQPSASYLLGQLISQGKDKDKLEKYK